MPGIWSRINNTIYISAVCDIVNHDNLLFVWPRPMC